MKNQIILAIGFAFFGLCANAEGEPNNYYGDDINLIESNVQASIFGDIWDKMKDAGEVLVSQGGKLVGKFLDVAVSIGKQIGPLIVSYGPSLIRLAGQMKPEYQMAAQTLAGSIEGLSLLQAQGAVAAVQPKAGEPPKSEDQVVANALALLNDMAKESATK